MAHTRSREFAPGHPVLFWLFIVMLAFALYSGAKALSTRTDCDSVTGGVKHWRIVPGEWICGSGGVEFSG